MDKYDQIMMRTNDPDTKWEDGKPFPVLTVMLHRVCENNPSRFEEACRLLRLVVKEALDQGYEDGVGR